MKAAILQTPGTLDIVDLAIDKPAPREVLIRTVGSGLCHSDLHAIDSSAMPRRPISSRAMKRRAWSRRWARM